MKFVVDTSVVIAVITNEMHKLRLIDLTKGAELIAPASLHWEIGNAFSAMFKRGRINLISAKKALRAYQKIPIQFMGVGLEDALDIASQQNIYAYDAYFLVCAQKLNIPLISLDIRLLDVARSLGVNICEVNL